MSQENKDNDKHELNVIRMKKMKALLEAQKRKEAFEKQAMSVWEKVDYVLKVVLMPDAYSRFNHLKENEPQVYQRVFNELVSNDVVQNIDYLMAVISQQGGVPRRIPLDVIIYLERKAKGIKSKIQVKQGDGDMMDLGSYLSKK